MTALTAIVLAVFIKLKNTRHDAYTIKDFGSFIAIGLILLCTIGSIIFICNNMSSSNGSLENNLMKINPEEQSSYAIIKNINSDKKYFYNNEGKEDKTEFSDLTNDEMRNIKIYYESGYKSIKNDTSDIEEYLGGKKGCEELVKNFEKAQETYKLTYILTGLAALMIILLVIMMIKKKPELEEYNMFIGFDNDIAQPGVQKLEAIQKLIITDVNGKTDIISYADVL